MIDDKLTPNELAKLELFSNLELAFFDGVESSGRADNITDKEEDAVYYHTDKHLKSVAKQWGMNKIFKKVGWDRDYY